MILNLQQNEGIAHKNCRQKNIEFAMLSQLFYTSTVHGKPSINAHSNVAYTDDYFIYWLEKGVNFF